jgi:hypothetical protein
MLIEVNFSPLSVYEEREKGKEAKDRKVSKSEILYNEILIYSLSERHIKSSFFQIHPQKSHFLFDRGIYCANLHISHPSTYARQSCRPNDTSRHYGYRQAAT